MGPQGPDDCLASPSLVPALYTSAAPNSLDSGSLHLPLPVPTGHSSNLAGSFQGLDLQKSFPWDAPLTPSQG